MDVYTTSFNVYPFAVPSSAQHTSYPPTNLPHAQSSTSSFNHQHSNLSAPALGGANSSQYGQQPLGGVPVSLPPTPSPVSASASAVHRHHSTNSGVELVWDHLHRLTLQAMAQYPGTHISFSRTASASSSSEDSLVLNGPSASSSMPMLSSLSQGGGVMSANANASLLNGPHTRGTAFNFTITGSSQANVMSARGLVLRESPVQNRSVIRVARSEILEPATRPQPGSAGGLSSVPMPGTGGGGALKQPVIQRLDEIAAQTRANISVLKTSSSSAASASMQSLGSTSSFSSWPPSFNGGGGGFGNGNFGGASAAAQAAGLEGEKMCELIITGPGDTVDVARLRLLVMLDELVRHDSRFLHLHRWDEPL